MPWRAVRLALEFDELVLSDAVYREVCDVLRRAKFDRYVAQEVRESFLENLHDFATFVPIREKIRACPDPTDDKFLEAAINGQVGIIVTGDRDLLRMRVFRDVRIITPSAYVAMTEAR